MRPPAGVVVVIVDVVRRVAEPLTTAQASCPRQSTQKNGDYVQILLDSPDDSGHTTTQVVKERFRHDIVYFAGVRDLRTIDLRTKH